MAGQHPEAPPPCPQPAPGARRQSAQVGAVIGRRTRPPASPAGQRRLRALGGRGATPGLEELRSRSARPTARPSCSPPAGQGRPGPAMESYDIIANQPVVIDNVRPGSRGEGGSPAPGGARRGAERDAPPRVSAGCQPDTHSWGSPAHLTL